MWVDSEIGAMATDLAKFFGGATQALILDQVMLSLILPIRLIALLIPTRSRDVLGLARMGVSLWRQ